MTNPSEADLEAQMRKGKWHSMLLFGLALLLGIAMIGCNQSRSIKDLAYMNVQVTDYSDDADPESDGVTVQLLLTNTKGKYIYFWNVPLLVDIELYAGKKNPNPPFDLQDLKCVYRGQATTRSINDDIKIPYDEFEIDPHGYEEYGIAKIVVHTPEQGDFTFDQVPAFLWH